MAYKCLPHRYKNLPVGLHARCAKKLSGQRQVPVLKDDRKVIHDSAAIIDYLDKEFPRFTLTPTDPKEKNDALEWERWADSEIGPAVRVLAYSVLIDRPDLLKPALIQDGPWYASFYINRAFPKIQLELKKGLQLDKHNISEAKRSLLKGAEKFLSQTRGLTPILSSGFSRADIAVAALWAPMFHISKYGLNWSGALPAEHQAFSEEFEEMRLWVEHIYAKHR